MNVKSVLKISYCIMENVYKNVQSYIDSLIKIHVCHHAKLPSIAILCVASSVKLVLQKLKTHVFLVIKH